MGIVRYSHSVFNGGWGGGTDEQRVMGLAPRLGRQKAHDVVYDCCRTSLTTGKAFNDALLDQPEIAAVFKRAEIEALTNPANHLGSAPQMTRSLLSRRNGNGWQGD